MTLIERVQAPTPKFFRKVRTGGLIMASVGASLLAAPASLPPFLLKLAGYLAVAGTVSTAISQTATTAEGVAKEEDHGS